MHAKVLVPLILALALGALLWSQSDPDGPAQELTEMQHGDEQGGALAARGPDAPLEGKAAPPTRRARGTQPKAPGKAATPAPARVSVPAGFEAKQGRIAGRVVDASGEPVAGALVRIYGPTPLQPAGPNATVEVRTNDDGWFRHEDFWTDVRLPYAITVALEDGRRVRASATPGDEPAQHTVVEGASLSGRLVPATADTPIADISLRLTRQGAPARSRSVIVRTDAEGHFAFEDLDPATYVLRSHRYGGSLANSEPSAKLYPLHVPDLTPPIEALDVPVRMGGVIAGVILGPDGHPVTTPITVELLGTTQQDDTDYSRYQRFSATEGSFRFTGLADGRYLLTFEPGTGAPGELAADLAPTKLESVAAGTEDLRVDMRAGVRLHGYVVGPDGNEVKARGNLYVRPSGKGAGGPESIVVRLQGESRFRSAPLEPGQSYDILVSAFQGYMDQSLEGVYPGEQELVIKLEPARQIMGTVKAFDGAHLPAAIPVSAHAPPGRRLESGSGAVAYTRTGGSFIIEGLGDFGFKLSAGGGSSGFVCASVASDVRVGTSDTVLKVRKGVPFSGRLVDERGDPVIAPRMGASGVPHLGGIDCAAKVEGEEGRFAFAGVPEGKIRVWAYVGGEYVRLGEFTAPAKDLTIKVPSR